MAINLGAAYVEIVPTTGGLAGALKTQVTAPVEKEASTAGTSFGEKFTSGIRQSIVAPLNSIGGHIVDSLTKWGKRGALAMTGVMAGGLWGGLKRVLDTEDATVAFRQMGLSIEEVDRALKGVDRTFDGTPFANPAGFNISAQLLASGRGLNQIEGDLRGISNVTAQTLNKDLDQTANTFLRIAAQGRAYAVDLNSLALQGIPIRQILASALNVTVSELNDMVSAGQITFDTMMDIVNSTERFEGAAQAMGSTTRGAFTNVLTGVSRLGQSFLGPLFGENGHAVTALLAIRQSLRGLTPWADEVGQQFAAWLVPAVESFATTIRTRVVPALQTGGNWLQRNRDQITKVVKAVVPAVTAVAGLATATNLLSRAFALAQAATPVGLILAIGSAFIYAYQNSEAFRETVNNAFASIMSFVNPIVSTVVGWFRSDIPGSLDVTGGRFQSIASSISSILKGLWDSIGIFVSMTLGAWDRFGETIMDTVGKAFDNIMTVIDGALKVISGVIDLFIGLVTLDFGRMKDGVVSIVSGLWDITKGLFSGALGALSSTVGLIRDAVAGAFNTMKDRVTEAVGAAVDWVQDRWNGLVSWVGELAGRISAAASGMWDSIPAAARAAFNAVIRFWNSTVGRISFTAPSWVPGFGGKGWSMPTFQEFHDGGVVPGRPGQEVPALLMAGETVLPTHKPGDVGLPGLDDLLAEIRALRGEVRRGVEQDLRLARTF